MFCRCASRGNRFYAMLARFAPTFAWPFAAGPHQISNSGRIKEEVGKKERF